MKLREMLTKAVRPRLSEEFSGLSLSVPEFDDDEPDREPLEEMASIGGLSLIIEYQDAQGRSSQRMITCRQFTVRADKQYLSAYCHHREAARQFRIDRIAGIFDASSGECLNPVQEYFAAFEPDSISKSGLTWGLSVGRRADLVALLNGLVFVARCDKNFHPAERESIEAALTSFWMRLEILGNPEFSEILAYADRLAPDGETFWVAMHRIKQDGALAEIFSRHAKLLIQSDGIIHEKESFWAIEIDDFLLED